MGSFITYSSSGEIQPQAACRAVQPYALEPIHNTFPVPESGMHVRCALSSENSDSTYSRSVWLIAMRLPLTVSLMKVATTTPLPLDVLAQPPEAVSPNLP